MDLLSVLQIIRYQGEAVREFGKRLGVSEKYASRITNDMHRKGILKRVRQGKKVLLFPNESSPLILSLERLINDNTHHSSMPIEPLVHPIRNLRLVGLLSTGPKTLEQITKGLDCSVPTFYRMLKPYGPRGAGIINITGTQDKIFSLDQEHPLHNSLKMLSKSVFPGLGVQEQTHVIEGSGRFTTLKSRVLIYLHSFIKYRDGYMMPQEITQKGISKGLWTTQQVLSKELKGLVDKGLLTERRNHVRNEKRMYKTYHLTSEGLKNVEDIKTMLQNITIHVVDLDGNHGMKKLDEITTAFRLRVRTVEMLNYLSNKDVLNYNRFQEYLETKRESDFISVLHRLPRLKYFFGREKERQDFRNWLEIDTSRVNLIKGIAGIGKTTYLTKVIQENKKNWNIFFYSIREWSTPRNLIINIAHFLEQLKKTRVTDMIENRADFDIKRSILIFEELFKDSRTLLIFDDVQKADTRMIDFLTAILKSRIVQDVKLVFAGRDFSREDAKGLREASKQVLELAGLDMHSSEQMLAGRGIHRSDFDVIYNFTGGHPLALELVDTGTGSPDMNLKLFIKEDVISKLTKPEKEILRFVSIFRHPFNANALLADHGNDEGIFDLEELSFVTGKKQAKKEGNLVECLVDRSILLHNGDSYYLHDIFKDFFYKRMDRSTKSKYHKLAADYYQRMDNDPAIVESIYHLVSAGEIQEAIEQMEVHGDTLIKRGFSQNLREILAGMGLDGLSSRSKVHLYFYRGEVENMLGNWEGAVANYLESLELCDSEELDGFKTRAHMKIAKIHDLQGEMEIAPKEFKRCIYLARQMGQIVFESWAIREVGTIFYFSGKPEGLKEYSQHALELAEATGSKECLANYYYLGSFVNQLDEDYEKCEAMLLECLGIYDELQDRNQLLIIMNNLGSTYCIQDKFEYALDMFREQIDLARSMGNFEMLAFGLLNSAYCLIHLSRLGDVEVQLKEAMGHFEMLDEKRPLLAAEANYALYYMKAGEFDLARQFFDRAIAGYKTRDMKDMLPEYLVEYGDMEKSLGNPEKAISHYREAYDYAKETGDKKMINLAGERLSTDE
jgi:tetratricopeptide (TPR) repeat protein